MAHLNDNPLKALRNTVAQRAVIIACNGLEVKTSAVLQDQGANTNCQNCASLRAAPKHVVTVTLIRAILFAHQEYALLQIFLPAD
jgi:hypothetical protein